jgi:glycosyltransferase involved in cell wall biosynthesis
VLKELSKRHHVRLYLQKPITHLQKEFTDDGIEVVSMSSSSTGDLKFWLNFSGQLKKEIKFLKNEAQNFDVVISSMFPMNILGNSIGLPHVQSCFQPFAFFWDPIVIEKLPLTQRIFLKIMRYKHGKSDIEYTHKSDKLLVPIKPLQKYVSDFYNHDSEVAYAGIDITFFKKTENEGLQQKYKNKKILIHSTDWTGTKNTNWLIDRFIEISSKINNAVLLITEVKSSGPERDKAIKKITENKLQNIKLCGFVPEELLPAYYSMADIGVYTGYAHKNSAASLWALECMSCETPVIRTDNTDEEVRHNETGFLYPVDDAESFQKFVMELLNNEELNLKFGKAARQYIEKTRSWEKTAEVFEQSCFQAISIHKEHDKD